MNHDPNSRMVKIFCPECEQKLDVSHVEPFSEASCPRCQNPILVPRRFGHYLLEEPIEQRRVCAVYQAIDLKLGRPVVVKIFSRELSGDPQIGEQLISLTKRLAVFNHPNILPVFSNGEHEGQYYIVTEYMSGLSLYHQVKQRYPLAIGDCLAYAVEAARGLLAASREGLLHGNLNPRNILLSADNHVKVGDFGMWQISLSLAENNETGMGGEFDARYMAPEVLDGRPGDCRSDIFSLGACLYLSLTGHPPFPENRRFAEAHASDSDESHVPAHSLSSEPIDERPDIDEELNHFILRMLATAPSERPTCYDHLIAGLLKLSQRNPVRPGFGPSMALSGAAGRRSGQPERGRLRSQMIIERLRRNRRKRRFVQIAGWGVLLLLLAVIVTCMRGRQQEAEWYRQYIAPVEERIRQGLFSAPRTIYQDAAEEDEEDDVEKEEEVAPEPPPVDRRQPPISPQPVVPDPDPEENDEQPDRPVGDGQNIPRFDSRPRPPDLNFRTVQDELQEYLRLHDDDLRRLERDRIVELSRLKGHLIRLMRIPYDGTDRGVLLADGRRLQGTVPYANEHGLTVRSGGPRRTRSVTLDWDELAIEQYFVFFQFYIDKRLMMVDAPQNEMLGADPERDSAQDYFRMALLADWYGFYDRAREYAQKAEELDDMMVFRNRRFLYYLRQ